MTGGTILAGLLIAVTAALSLLHFYWGLGGAWPGTDAASLARMVVGVRSGRMPGLVPSLFVAACLLAVAAFIAWRAGWFSSFGLQQWLWSAGYGGATLVFAARGLAGFSPAIFSYADGTPFARLNLIIYSPLCLAIAAGMIVLWLTRRPEG